MNVEPETYIAPERHPGPTAMDDAPLLSVPQFQVPGMNFVVTGGTMGLGATISEALIKAGASRVMIGGRRADIGIETAQRLRRLASEYKQQRDPHESDEAEIFYQQLDQSRPEDCESFVKAAIEKLSDIHGLVNAAASTERGDLESTTVEFWDRLIDTNVRGPWLITEGIAKHMANKRIQGSIVNISSVASLGGNPKAGTYSVTKQALNGLTRVHAYDFQKYRIRVNAVCMGTCVTDYEDGHQKVELGTVNWLEKRDEGAPLGRILRPIDVAATVGFLLSDQSVTITGTLVEQHPERMFACWD